MQPSSTSLVNIHSSERSNSSDKPFYCSIKLNKTTHNVRKLELVTMELPVGWYNISAALGNNTMRFSPHGQTTLSDGIYTLDDLIAALNSALPSGYVMGQYTYSKKLHLTPSTTVIFYSTVLSRELGFSSSDVTSTFFTASTPPRILAHDLYVNFHVANLPTNISSRVPCTFKVPVTVQNNYIQFYDERSDPGQSIIFDTPLTISQLDIRIYNVDGVLLDNNDMDWSATFRMT